MIPRLPLADQNTAAITKTFLAELNLQFQGDISDKFNKACKVVNRKTLSSKIYV